MEHDQAARIGRLIELLLLAGGLTSGKTKAKYKPA
jgi:hypothetical protein